MLARRPFAFAVLSGLLLAALIGKDVPKLYELSRKGVKTTGLVTTTRCEQHGSYSVRFQVHAEQFEVPGRGGAHEPCDRLKGGEPATVYYLPDDPTITTGREPTAELWEAILWALGVPAVLACVVYVGLVTRRR